MVHKKIEKLIPYINENFITYPLFEEGKYIPFINFWQIAEQKNSKKNVQFYNLEKKLCRLFNKNGYEIWYIESTTNDSIHYFQCFPKFKELKNGSYIFVKKDWSIEEMVELLIKALK